MVTAQEDLFGAADDRFPEGLRYSSDVAPLDLQRSVLEAIPALPFKAFEGGSSPTPPSRSLSTRRWVHLRQDP